MPPDPPRGKWARTRLTSASRWTIARAVSSVVVPVSIAMALCVWLVLLLRDDFGDAATTGGIFNAVYTEKNEDTNDVKLKGSVMNAAVFVAFITLMTFALFLCFKYRMGALIWGYMGFSGLLIFGLLGSDIVMRVLQKLDLAVDMVTVSLALWNFTVGGVLMTFFWPGPLTVKQGYLICVSTIVSFYFTQIPAWTTWSVLIAMALYDLYAVLTPNGPLRLMVELAQERNEDIPALVYESRSVVEREGRERYLSQRAAMNAGGETSSAAPVYDPEIEDVDVEGNDIGLPDAIKLGLGDFIFYSVLVGRAAMWSWITCAFCFVAVIFGLVLTLVILSVHGKALPALPISIGLGAATYFLSRFFIEPAIVQAYARAFVCD